MRPLGAEQVTLTRYAAGSRATGEWVEGAATTSMIWASVQPMPGRDRQNLPEGLRERDVRKVFTETMLRPASQHSGTSADRIDVDGVAYEVMTVTPWRAVLVHYEVVVARVQESYA